MSLKPRRINPSAILINFLGLYGVALLAVIVPEVFGVRQRGFYCDNATIQNPFYDHTIPMGQLTWASLTLFMIIPLLTEFLLSYSEQPTASYRWRKISIPPFVVQALLVFGYSHIGLVIQIALTQYVKYGAGRLRPHFMDVCKPVGYICSEPNQYITDFTCSGDNKFRNHETRLSFFSGHSSTAIYTAVFIAIYLETRVIPRLPWRRLVRAVQILLTIAALFVCVTRITDNFHHPTDVIVGIAFGIVVAVVTASRIAGLCSYDIKPNQQPKGISMFAYFVSPIETKG